MFHNFKYSLRIILKNKQLIFWSILWPIILGTMFYFAFSDIEKKDKLNIFDIAIVENEKFNEETILKETLKELSDKKSNNYFFNIKYTDLKNSKTLLSDKKIEGYIIVGEKTKIVVKEEGINQTVLKTVIDEIYEYETLVKRLIENEYSKAQNTNISTLYTSILKKINSEKENFNDKSQSNMNYMMIEFYSLVAMTCLFGSLLTSTVIGNYLANINKKGARITLSKANHLKIILSGLLASFVIQLICIAALLLYTHYLLNVDFGNKTTLVILLSVVGSVAGLALGVLLGTISFKNENTRTAVICSITMFGSFLAGMMGITTKYVVDKNIPLLNKINPVNMITDGFYALYYYEYNDKFYFNVASLLIFSFILLFISYLLLRRKKYDSI
jgi:ABC-type multidrug transport system, permease component